MCKERPGMRLKSPYPIHTETQRRRPISYSEAATEAFCPTFLRPILSSASEVLALHSPPALNMTSQPKINLVYVASIGRSGTTLLESMLGAHPEMATTGELHLWPHELEMGGVRPCGSGKYVQECPFWQTMRKQVDPLAQTGPQLHYFREEHNGGRTLRLRRLSDFASGELSPRTARLVQQYGQNNYEIFHHFLNLVEAETGTRPGWVVDASKDPYRLLWLQRSGLFNIKVVHMVKNPRGFIYSVTKDWIHGNTPFRLVPRIYYTARQSLAWTVQNHLFSLITEHFVPPSASMLLQYETLATAPHSTFKSVCDLIGVAYEPDAVDHFREGSPYAMAGNPMRYEDRGIALDEHWKTHLPPSSRKLTEWIVGRRMVSYGYQ